MTNLVAFPVLLAFATGILLLLLHGRVALQRVIAFIAALGLFGVAFLLTYTVWHQGIQVQTGGDWPVPFGITLAADLFSGMMVTLSGITLVTSLLFAFRDLDPAREQAFFYPVLFFMVAGINLSFLTGDLFNLFVAFEVMLISSYFLLTIGGAGGQLREGLKYLILNATASTLFLVAIAMLYGVTASLNMADVAQKVASIPGNPYITLIGVLFMVVFASKGGLFPLYFWLPRSYFFAPNGIVGFFAAMLTKVGVYSLIRVFTLIFVHDVSFTHTFLLWIAGFTMLLGVLGAVAQHDFKAILAYHSISQTGYMIMGLGLYSQMALAGTLIFIAHHSFVKSGLFLLAGITQRITGSTDLKKFSGLLADYPGLAFTFLATAISLAGVPPFSGFFAKFAQLKAGVDQQVWPIVTVSLVVSIFTLFSMVKIYRKGFWGKASGERIRRTASDHAMVMVPALILLALSIGMGLGAGPLMKFTLAAAEQLMNPSLYIQAVMGR